MKRRKLDLAAAGKLNGELPREAANTHFQTLLILIALICKYTMRVQVVLLVLLAWHAASVTGDSSEHDAQSTFKYTEPPLSPEVASSPPLELPSSSPTESEGSRSHFDYRRKPPDFVFPPWDHAGFYKSPPPPPHVESKFPEWVKTKNGGFFKRERKRNLALLSAMDQKFVQADVLIYGDSVTALNKPTNLSTGIKGSRKPFSRNFGDLYAEPLGVPADRIGNLMWRLAVGTERPVFQNPKVGRKETKGNNKVYLKITIAIAFSNIKTCYIFIIFFFQIFPSRSGGGDFHRRQ